MPYNEQLPPSKDKSKIQNDNNVYITAALVWNLKRLLLL